MTYPADHEVRPGEAQDPPAEAGEGVLPRPIALEAVQCRLERESVDLNREQRLRQRHVHNGHQVT